MDDEIERRSKDFLKIVAGEENFDRLQKDGKIEIEHDNGKDKIVYELYSDGRVINKTKNQSYCIVSDRSDYPNYDMVAIKFAWLTHRNEIAEKVANKTSLNVGTANRPGYEEYVHYLSSNGWQREQLTIGQYNTNIVTTRNVGEGTTGAVVNVTCPAGMRMSIMGMRQISRGVDARDAYSLGLYIADNDGKEILDSTQIRIVKMRPSEFVKQLARLYYQDIKMTRDGEANYRFQQGIELNGGDYFQLFAINSPIHICSDDVQFKMEVDLWTR